MKKLILTIAVVLMCQCFAFCQGCLPEGITFTTQEQIDNFQTNYPGCTEIEGDVTIRGTNINNLNGLSVLNLIGGYFSIGGWPDENYLLTSLTGLDNLSSIGGEFRIDRNNALPNLTGLESLTSIGGNFCLWSNDAMTCLTGLESLAFIGGGLQIGNIGSGNPALTSLTGMQSPTIDGYLVIAGNDALSNLTGLESMTSVGGDLIICGNNALVSLSGLEGLTSIGGSLYIGSSSCGNQSLVSLTGLEGLSNIGGDLVILQNYVLTSLTGLEGLTSIVGSLVIGNYFGSNPSLSSLEGLDNVISVGGDLFIGYNYALTSLSGLDNLITIGGLLSISANDALTSLSALENLTSVGWTLSIYVNDALTSLTGLENIADSSINDLIISDNFSLSSCAVQSICDYLAAPNGTVTIENNAPGCNSEEEVEEACLSVGVPLPGSLQTEVNIYPNPTGGILNFGFRISECQRLSLKIYDALGREVAVLPDEMLPAGEHSIEWDMEALPAGIYSFRLQTDSRLSTGKLIKL
ncbi:protein containing Por secretion system C-terminal sorting domain [Lentimicrobium saccharophilum]|uniref:Protein containing Por secretion system C-terminal sorting domain n=1 Tax=Lentimicrobium saccharophilum TaxID=1678841 RepID=A0A0S7C2C7_9BACT|nr:T9SS type A sorting domain-containing protein [Lentimicrobium saccharophilum]GAP42979.1 protein containing Por secretion system C-terminal sorting domain [Lentimicrobium saccharophilum]